MAREIFVDISKKLAEELLKPVLFQSIEDANKKLEKAKAIYRVADSVNDIHGNARVKLVAASELPQVQETAE